MQCAPQRFARWLDCLATTMLRAAATAFGPAMLQDALGDPLSTALHLIGIHVPRPPRLSTCACPSSARRRLSSSPSTLRASVLACSGWANASSNSAPAGRLSHIQGPHLLRNAVSVPLLPPLLALFDKSGIVRPRPCVDGGPRWRPAPSRPAMHRRPGICPGLADRLAEC